jgi:hypothetical protein
MVMSSNSPLSRNHCPHHHAGTESSLGDKSEPADAPAAMADLEDAIEDERARLMDAESILHCVVIAMSEGDPADTHAPYYQNVIGIAREILVESINRLDSVRMRPILERFASGAT